MAGWHETVVYECHVKGFTMRHPDIPPHPVRWRLAAMSRKAG